jgi:hypothetical protein
MGTNCAPLLADLFLYSYESEFLQKLVKDKKIHEGGEPRKQVLEKGKQQTTPNEQNPENRCLRRVSNRQHQTRRTQRTGFASICSLGSPRLVLSVAHSSQASVLWVLLQTTPNEQNPENRCL